MTNISVTSTPALPRSFIDAAADAVARAVAGMQREAATDRALREAEHRARIAELDAALVSVRETERRLADRLATLKDGQPGASVTVDDVAPLISAEIERRVADLPPAKDGADGKDGTSVTIEHVAPMVDARMVEAVAALNERIAGEVASAVAALPPAQPGKDADPEVMRMQIAEAVAALPVPKDGKDGRDGAPGERGERGFGLDDFDTELIEEGRTLLLKFARGDYQEIHEIPLPVARDGRDGVDGKDGERGEAGPPGALPAVKAWVDRVHYQGDVVTHDGAVYQAACDTGRAPGHDDWACIVERGRDGADGQSMSPTGPFDPTRSYRRLEVAMLNGASFVATRDEPGACPGDGWRLLAAQGRQGKPGERGPAGIGSRGLPGEPVKSVTVDGEGLLTLTNGDGSTVECDLYPVLSKLVS